MDVVGWLPNGLTPELVWGLFPRTVGFVYLLALGALVNLHVAQGGKGSSPLPIRLAFMRRHFPGVGRFFRKPTLFWISSSDVMLRAVPAVGVLGACTVIYGGPLGPWALLLCWVCWLSLNVVPLVFPWHSLLLEMGFLALFLPAVPALPELAADTTPLPLVKFMIQWLPIRLMWGFAKTKFIGSGWNDRMYLRGFLTWQPMPTPIGWYMQHAPAWLLTLAYSFMFVAEVVMPGLALIPGDTRVIAAAGLCGLMLGIWATGNWGFFNIGYIAFCVCLLDHSASVLDVFSQPASNLWATPSVAATNLTMASLFLLTLIYFPFYTFVSEAWPFWYFEYWTRRYPWLRVVLGAVRAIAPFRLVSAYGVFPPSAPPQIKPIFIFEGSDDKQTWLPYTYNFMPTQPSDAPRFCAPHHPMLDQSATYPGLGVSRSDMTSSLLGDAVPYDSGTYSHYSPVQLLVQRLLEGDAPFANHFRDNPFPDRPPKWIRVSLLAITPTTLEEKRTTGNWWHVRRMCVLYDPVQSDPTIWKRWLEVPECLHPDHVAWRRRAPALQAVLAAEAAGTPRREAVCIESDIPREDVDAFWHEVVPFLTEPGRHNNWARLAETVRELRCRYDMDRLYRFERILERYAWLLRQKLEPHFFGDAPELPFGDDNFLFHLMLQEVVLDRNTRMCPSMTS
ncbi:MAG: lipase maturation factor family protein [Myxococcales bacterium]|nr:lipase maturation factor family protein [Myxococcales bacterium]